MTDAELKAPGLYLRTLETEAAATSRSAVTAFVGITERGPLHDPQTLRNYGDFLEVFGGAWDFGVLAESVNAFFLNGGEEACVVRVARLPPIATPSVSDSCPVKEELAIATCKTRVLDANGLETLRIAARNPGNWGNRLQARFQTDSGREMDLAHLTAPAAAGAEELEVDFVYDFRVGGRLRLIHRINAFLKSVHEVVALDKTNRRLTLDPALPQDYPTGSTVSAAGFRLEVTDGTRREIFDGLSMNPSHLRYFVAEVNGPAARPYLSLAREGHSLLVSVAQVLGADGLPRFKPDSTGALTFSGGGDGVAYATAILKDSSASPGLIVTARIKGREGNGIRVKAEAFMGMISLPVPERPGAAKDQLVIDDIHGWAVGDTLTINHATVSETAKVAAVFADKHVVVLAAPLVNDYPLGSGCSVASRFNLFIECPASPETTELFFNLSLSPGPRFCADLVNGSSRLVCIAAKPEAAGPLDGSVVLSGGTDPDEIPLQIYTGYNDGGALFKAGSEYPEHLGLAALESSPEVSLISVPDVGYRKDLTPSDRAFAQTQVLFHCQKMGERFALLDMPQQLTPAQALEWPAHFADPKLARYGALYYPWIWVATGEQRRLLPPSGAVAGLIARTDRQYGVGRAPANLQFKGVVGTEHDLDASEQGELNLAGVNCIRKFEVGALRLGGARTLGKETNHLYVHNRRVVLFAIKAMTSGLRWAVFEPNDQNLRRRIKDSLEGFLGGMLASGLTAGTKPEEAFYVKVDDGLNSAETPDMGQVLAEVGIALSRPAEFLVIAVKRRPEILTLVEDEA